MKKNLYYFTYTELIDGMKCITAHYEEAYTAKEAYAQYRSKRPYKVDKMEIFINYNLDKKRKNEVIINERLKKRFPNLYKK